MFTLEEKPANFDRNADRYEHSQDNQVNQPATKAKPALEFAKQAQRLAQYSPEQENEETGSTQAVEAKFITAQDPVIVTADGGRLPAVPLEEALKLNRLRDEVEGRDPDAPLSITFGTREAKDGTIHGVRPPSEAHRRQTQSPGAPLSRTIPKARTNPLFPPLPTYGPPTLLRNFQCLALRTSSAVLSLCFLGVIVLGALFTSIPNLIDRVWLKITLRSPEKRRPFYQEEQRRKEDRRIADRDWDKKKRRKSKIREIDLPDESQNEKNSYFVEDYVPTAGGQDPLVCNVDYYARRVGLASETFLVQTEDGFIIELWHIYNPLTQRPKEEVDKQPNSSDIFDGVPPIDAKPPQGSKYPVLLIHGLLQSSGAFCCNDEYSLAFWLAKAGLDVWLGNNRCGFKPRHTMLKPTDPRMWAWNIRQMGVMDLPALVSRVLKETAFPKVALIAHSQGTTQTLVALAKEQRPEIGRRISVACLLAPAAYAGPLIGKMYFKFMRVISPNMFRAMFGIHSFIPFMMRMHSLLPGKLYGAAGYAVFSFLFNWTDTRWEADLRDRFFQFAPVYVSAESMRWWLGRECFAKQRCILSTQEEGRLEDAEDEEEDSQLQKREDESSESEVSERNPSPDRGNYAWYDENVPPFALWVAGSDDLVNGQRLLRRFERGREPYVEVVHSKIIPDYEHLDVIWAVDAIDTVFTDVLRSIWKTVPEECRHICSIPHGCQDLKAWKGRDRSL